MNSPYWLFSFTSYSYCQGTRDSHRGDLRLLKFTLPCEEWEAKSRLEEQLKSEKVEFDKNSIKSLTILITNS